MHIDNLKIDDIVADCWGYSMTLYSFYKVINKTDKTVTFQPMDKIVSDWIGFMQCEVIPGLVDENAKPIKKVANKDGYIHGIDGRISLYIKGNEYIEDHAD